MYTAGIVGAASFIKTDNLFKAAQYAEEYSPGKIFRTFHASTLLSPLTSQNKQTRYFSQESITRLYSTDAGKAWLETLEKLTNDPLFVRNVRERGGFRFESDKLLYGIDSSEVILDNVSVTSKLTSASPKFQEGYLRSLYNGPVKDISSILDTPIKFSDSAGKQLSERFIFTGGKSKTHALYRGLSGYTTSLIERMNSLARTPFELEPLASIIKNTPLINKIRLDVIPSSGLKTFAKMTGKLGLIGGAVSLAYQQLDYYARKSSVLDNTLFDEGITAGLASIYTKGTIANSKIADAFGLHSYRERQEEIAPGSTSIGTLTAFPIMGMLGGVGVGYGKRLIDLVDLQQQGHSLQEASLLQESKHYAILENLYNQPIKESHAQLLNPDTLASLRETAERELSGPIGKFTRKIVNTQRTNTLEGKVLRSLGKVTPNKLLGIGGFLAGAALVAPFIPGALIPGHRPEELEDLYSGRKNVEVRRGRNWLLGRTKYEGERASYTKPHWYRLLQTHAKEKAIWGEDAPSPISRWYKSNFTYEVEEQHYYDRPTPLSGRAFYDVPFVGPILSKTIGQLVKPQIMMHQDELFAENYEGEIGLTPMPLNKGQTRNSNELVLNPGEPINPLGLKAVAGETIYRNAIEMIGLPGFVGSSITKKFTGSEVPGEQETRYASADKITSISRSYWDAELGDIFGASELTRRLIPRPLNYPEYNPIPNTLSTVDWLPGAGASSPNFKIGDPYSSIPYGDVRLPGQGYEALFPELKGVNPNDYPTIRKLSILADVAPYTSQYKSMLGQTQNEINRGLMPQEDIKQYRQILENVEQRKKSKDFTEYKYKEFERTPIEQLLTAANESSKQIDDSPSWFERNVGGYWEGVSHNAETPLDFLTPVSPGMKLVHVRNAVEDYERTQVYSSTNSFWDHPIRDFIHPFMARVKHDNLGWNGIPGKVQSKRDLTEYFDILKYVKYTRLKNAANFDNNASAANNYESKSRKTLFGTDPFKLDSSNILRAIPRTERDYFKEFIGASIDEREKILKMLPDNQKDIYTARWKLKDAANLNEAINRDLLTKTQTDRAETLIQQVYKESENEGMPRTQKLWTEYLGDREGDESYGDWYRRAYLIEEKLDKLGMNLPGPSWVGYSPLVNDDLVKLKVVENEGMDTFDYDMWPSQQREAMLKPYINSAAIDLINQSKKNPDREELRGKINEVLHNYSINSNNITMMARTGDNSVDITFNTEQDRSKEIERYIKRRGINN